MARRNIFAALVLIAVGTWYGVLTAALPDRTLPNTPGPSFFPWLIGLVLIGLSIALLVQGIVARRTEPREPVDAATLRRGAYALVWFVAYVAALPYVGFLWSSIPFFGGLMLLYGGRNRLYVAIAAALVPLLLFFIFRHGFQILLPRGVF